MSKENYREMVYSGGRDEFYFRHNYYVMVGGPAVVCVTCMFWLVLDCVKDDMFGLVESGMVSFVVMLVAVSLLMIVYQFQAKNELNGRYKEKDNRFWYKRARPIVIAYFILLIVSVCAITISNNVLLEHNGVVIRTTTVSLSTAYLFMPVLAVMPRKLDGLLVCSLGLAASFVPLFAPGAECYVWMPEILLRIGLIVSYFVVKYRVEETYRMQESINDYANSLRVRNEKLANLSEDVVSLLGDIVERRDIESGEHIQRVHVFTRILAECVMEIWPEYALDEHAVELITKTSALHDVGKIMIPDSVLLKPGRLTKEEFEIMKTHSEEGYKILVSSTKSWDEEFLKYACDIAYCHHEKYDGKGYPRGLVGDEIPIAAQIVSMADCYDALTSERRYKGAYTCDEAFEIIYNGECGQFSDKMLAVLTACRMDLEHATTNTEQEYYPGFREKI